ncbi:MAG: SAM-dependent methyltransferase [Acidimicrobiia bacterium]
MTTTVEPTDTEAIEAKAGALAERIFGTGIAALELVTIDLGNRLGLYRTLRDDGPATPAELAQRAGIHERYAREWLEQQSVAGILEVDDSGADPDDRRYTLPAGHDVVLLDEDSPAHMSPVAAFVTVAGKAVPSLERAFRTGAGVPYAEYELHDLQAGFTRPLFVNLFASEWVPKIPGLRERLQDDPPARVLDVGCGEGWSSIALAQGYPKATVTGIDLDDASIAVARRNAAEAGVDDRVTFEVRDAADAGLAGGYDAAFCFEMVHDLSDPVGVLAAVRKLVRDDGAVVVADERCAEEFTAPGDELERFFYAASVVHCLPVGMAEQPSAGTGTVIRPSILDRYAKDAGFTGADVLPIENDFWRFYRLS